MIPLNGQQNCIPHTDLSTIFSQPENEASTNVGKEIAPTEINPNPSTSKLSGLSFKNTSTLF